MGFLVHGLIFVGLTLMTKWGGIVWLLIVLLSRTVRRGIRRLLFLAFALAVGWVIFWSTQTGETQTGAALETGIVGVPGITS
jgi:hypothetical protein